MDMDNEWEKLYRVFQKMGGVPESEWREGRKLFKAIQMKKGDIWPPKGERFSDLLFIHRGLIEGRHQSSEGKEYVITFFMEDDFILPLNPTHQIHTSLPDDFISENFRVIEDCLALRAPYADFVRLYDRHQCWERIGRLFAERSYMNILKKEEQLLFKSGKDRYLDFVRDYPHLMKRVPQYLVASFLGLTPQSLCRMMKREGLRVRGQNSKD